MCTNFEIKYINNTKIGAIMVLYNPDWSVTERAIVSLASQVSILCVVDNSPNTDNTNKIPINTNIHYLSLNNNKGIAYAQNQGIKILKSKVDFIVFSDQDSIIQTNIISQMIVAYNKLTSLGLSISTVGPTPINRQTLRPYITPQNLRQIIPASSTGLGYDVYEMYGIISSLSLMKISAFDDDEIGLYNERLFIDGVESEWCWRGAFYKHKYPYLLRGIEFSHFQGEGKSIKIKKSSPFRTYYQFRNFLWLKKLHYTPKYWKKLNTKKFLAKTILYPLLFSPRLQYLKSILHGYYDGLRQHL